eukprot:2590888-Rhodomonas_salina.2
MAAGTSGTLTYWKLCGTVEEFVRCTRSTRVGLPYPGTGGCKSKESSRGLGHSEKEEQSAF